MGALLIVGAGLSGAVLARELAEHGHHCRVLESREHPGGHCHTERDPHSGVLMHVYGPHIFHSDDASIWGFVQRFAEFRPFRHRVLARVGDQLYPLPVDLDTLSQFFGRELEAADARNLLRDHSEGAGADPGNFEEQALATVGRELYETFFRGYTCKQWGRDPRDLPAALFRRLPVRFDRDGSYFHHSRVGMPVGGYTALVSRMLDHPRIEVCYGIRYRRGDQPADFVHTFYTGGIDRFFDCDLGRLPYRSLRFEHFHAEGDFQAVPVVNYPEPHVPWTRITEHKRFAPWEHHATTVCSREYSQECGPHDEPYYPVTLAGAQPLLERYRERAHALPDFSFVGRLATFQYIDMDVAITRARTAAAQALDCLRERRPIPAFF